MEARSDGSGGMSVGLKAGLAVIVALVIVGGFVLLRGGGDEPAGRAEPVTPTGGDDGDTETGETSEATEETLGEEAWGAGYDGSLPPARLAYDPDEDPRDAPDCDPETGRIMIPSFYAPNCVPLWPEGRDNGGATHRGVTADEIVVAIYAAEGDPILEAQVSSVVGESTATPEETAANRQLVLDAYNALFETYGRTVRVETLEATGSGSDDAAARADALRASEEIGAFAVLGGPSGTTAFADTLAANGVLCFCAASQPIEFYEDHAPYVWGDLMASTELYLHRVAYVGERLIGKPAVHAGDPAMREQERKIAIVYYETAEGTYGAGVDFFEDQLRELYDYELAGRIAYVLDSSRLQEDATTVVAQLKDGGITTVVFAGDPIFPMSLTAEATRQEYFPEWIVTGSTMTDTNAMARGFDQQQWRNAFGISSLTIGVNSEATQQEANLVSWFQGEEISSYPSIIALGRLFAGIHLAGPNLTPETFRDALFSLMPVEGGITRTGVSFGRGIFPWDSYTSFDDVTEIWWDPEAESPSGQIGMYRYVDGGARILPGGWSAEDRAFDPEGALTIYDERPEADRAPRYPRRSGRDG